MNTLLILGLVVASCLADDYSTNSNVGRGGYGGGLKGGLGGGLVGGGFRGFGGGVGGGFGGGFGGGLPYGGLGLALNSVQNQNQMGLFGGAGGQSTLGGGIAHSMLNTVSNINVHFNVSDIVYSF